MTSLTDPWRIRLRLLSLPTILVAICAAAAPLAAQETFVRVGDMTVGGNYPTAALLSDGRVLVAGGTRTGTSGSVYNKEAEIYDPTTMTFTATGSMSVPRFGPGMVRLNDGRVLVFGGDSGASSSSSDDRSAELFDPTKGTFTPTGSMAVPRYGASAALLGDGRVLVIGGTYGAFIYSDSEIYDPTAGTFSAGPTLTAFHVGSSEVVALPNGKVLVFGSVVSNGVGTPFLPSASVDLYDPTAGTFSAFGQLSQARANPVATLLPDGTVAVSGGLVTASNGLSTVTSNTVEVFDPSTGKSSMPVAMSVARVNHVAVALANGQVLLAGGFSGASGVLTFSFTSTGSATSTASADLFDPKTGKITPLAPLTVSRGQAAAALLPTGDVLVMGGITQVNGALQARLQSAELFRH